MYRIGLGVLVLALTGCVTPPSEPGSPAAVEFIVVRHGEKIAAQAEDPQLSASGLKRAAKLARLFSDTDITTVYSTDFRRTRQTAAPTAEAHRLNLSLYDAQIPAAEWAASLRARHVQGAILIVGHSNTVPDIVSALSGEAVEAIPESQYELIYRVAFAADGSVDLQRTQFGAID